MWVKPTNDPTRARIVDPGTLMPLPAEGKRVPDHDNYWLRRIAQGDVVRGDDPLADKSAGKTESAAAPSENDGGEHHQ